MDDIDDVYGMENGEEGDYDDDYDGDDDDDNTRPEEPSTDDDNNNDDDDDDDAVNYYDQGSTDKQKKPADGKSADPQHPSPSPSSVAATPPKTPQPTTLDEIDNEHITDSKVKEELPLAPSSSSQPAPAPDMSRLKKKQGHLKDLTHLAKQHILNTQLVDRHIDADAGVIVVTWANYHYLDFVQNWVYHLKEVAGCNSFLVGAMDDALLQALLDDETPVFAMSSGLTLDDFGWGTPTFHKMGREKIRLILAFTTMGYDVLISDVDTVWMRNPLPFIRQYPDADILTSSDHLRHTVPGEELELWPDAASAANIGIMLFRKTARKLAQEWVDMLGKNDKIWDQNAFNDLFTRGMTIPDPPREDHLFGGYDRELLIGILPVSLFCSGHTFFVQNMYEKLGLLPYVAHATFQYSGTPGKRFRFKERMLWKESSGGSGSSSGKDDAEESYFSHPAGFITYNNDIPQQLLDDVKGVDRGFEVSTTIPHFNLVNHQLSKLRAGFFLATILGRALVLPDLLCGFDRWWAPHDGTIPGSELDLPFHCPADHVLDLEAMYKSHDESSYGSKIEFREYSFLKKKPARDLNASVVVIYVCSDKDDNGEGCADGKDGKAAEAATDTNSTTTTTTTTIRIKPNLSDTDLLAVLSSDTVKQAKVLDIQGNISGLYSTNNGTSTTAAFSSNATKNVMFKRRLDLYGAIWCCSDAHPGHVWYDFFWDVDSHRDRHNRDIAGGWTPLTGP